MVFGVTRDATASIGNADFWIDIRHTYHWWRSISCTRGRFAINTNDIMEPKVCGLNVVHSAFFFSPFFRIVAVARLVLVFLKYFKFINIFCGRISDGRKTRQFEIVDCCVLVRNSRVYIVDAVIRGWLRLAITSYGMFTLHCSTQNANGLHFARCFRFH